ncbi:MAG: beta-N-acetylhexosaminidase [Limnochordia bacterium]|jgi:beta-N-acetylhexosaminidase|nr:beta-N-acetylhexosaminidase [Limnochordia bacterium]
MLSLEAKIGQLLMFGFTGTTVSPHIKKFIVEHNLGGVIHFARNVQDPRQLAQLNQEFQALAKQSPSGSELFLAVDQEGGTVARLTKGVTVLPSAMALGASASAETTEKVCEMAGLELRATGINMNLAPVVDVNNNPLNPVIGVRSFGENPADVAKLGGAAIRGYQRYVAAVAKHFPGHGDTDLDSHLALPVIRHSRKRLDQVELVPFKEAIAQGVTGIMTAHVVFPAIEDTPGLPSTLSYQVLNKLLREELGFAGLIMTDCMEMAAIKETYGTVEAAVMAIEAGADMVLISQTEKLQNEALTALVAAVKTGRISEARIDESLGRIRRAKEQLQRVQPDLTVVGSPQHIAVLREAIQQSITIVRHEERLPLRDERVLVIEPGNKAATVAEDVLMNMGSLSISLRANGLVNVDDRPLEMGVSQEDHDLILAEAQGYDKVVVVTSDAHRDSRQAQFVRDLVQSGVSVIVVGSRTPYELAVLPQAITYVAAYGSRPLVWDEVSKVLLGKERALGKLPVSIVGV